MSLRAQLSRGVVHGRRGESEVAVVTRAGLIAGRLEGVSDLTGCEVVAVHAEGPERS
jgi:hypothetical protein